MSMAAELDYDVYYWRELGKGEDREVDFIVSCGGELTAIEVKSGRRRTNSGLPAFTNSFPPLRIVRCRHRRREP